MTRTCKQNELRINLESLLYTYFIKVTALRVFVCLVVSKRFIVPLFTDLDKVPVFTPLERKPVLIVERIMVLVGLIFRAL